MKMRIKLLKAEVAKLEEENKQLKAEIAELKKEKGIQKPMIKKRRNSNDTTRTITVKS